LIRKARELSEKMKNEPINFVKNAMVCGGYAPHPFALIDRAIAYWHSSSVTGERTSAGIGER